MELMSYVGLLLASSSLDARNIKNNERRWFALHPKTGKRIVPKKGNNFKDFISNKIVEIKDDRR